MSLLGHHTGVIKVVAKSNEYISFLSQTSKTNMLQLEQNVHFNHNLISKIWSNADIITKLSKILLITITRHNTK